VFKRADTLISIEKDEGVEMDVMRLKKFYNLKINSIERTMICCCAPLLLAVSCVIAGNPYPGYNFYTISNISYLDDLDGNNIHTWTCSKGKVMGHAHLLRDSSVLFPYIINNNGFTGTAQMPGGGFQIIKWDGTVSWEYTYYSSTYVPDHDIEPIYYTNDINEKPSILVICSTVEKGNGKVTSNKIAELKPIGSDSATVNKFTSNKIIELKPVGSDSATVKWEWYAYDHHADSGTGTDSAQLLDLKYGYTSSHHWGWFSSEWLHSNNLSYNPKLDQIILSINFLSEFIILDHSTTSEEAASHSGGKYGKGGDILYRWGCPSNYGCSGTQYLHRPHGACWISNYMPGTRKPLPGAGHVLDLSNESEQAYEIALPGTNGVYTRTAKSAYEPSVPTKTFSPEVGIDQGNMQRLPNGNTLIHLGSAGGAAEYDSSGNIVATWTSDEVGTNQIFRIDSAYLGSTSLDTGYYFNAINTASVNNRRASCGLHVSCSMGKGVAVFTVDGAGNNTVFSVFSTDGRAIFRRSAVGNVLAWNCGNVARGAYYVQVTSGNKRGAGRFLLGGVY